MPHDPARLREVRDWLVRAARDLRAAELGATVEPPLAGDAVFHCQQVAEKSLKAFLAWHDQPFRKTHNLLELGQQCVGIDPTLEDVARRAAVLTEYAWRYRYPGEPEEPPLAEVREAMALARALFMAVLARLPSESRP